MARETRICGTCGNPIIVNRQNIDNIAYYKGYHHHVGCLIDKANKGIESGKRVAIYQRLLDRIPELQAEARRRLDHSITQDEFNDYLLDHYNVIEVSKRFWNIVFDIEKGVYKRKKCRPIDMNTIFQTWKWGQKWLDKTNENNKRNHRGPINDEQRLNYDLAIVVSKIPNYLTHIEKEKANIAEIKRTSTFDEVDMSKIRQKEIEKKEGISDIFEGFFS